MKEKRNAKAKELKERFEVERTVNSMIKKSEEGK